MSRPDALYCARIVRTHARTFTLASYFLPAPKRRAAFALYAFCRVADDMVDRADEDGLASTEHELATYERQLAAALAGRPVGPIFRELHWVVTTYHVPPEPLHELVAGVARDLRPVHYGTWADLERYCASVASTVGVMCAYVFGVTHATTHATTRALDHARTLGVAMQLTNILRDIGEDARRGRCYLPEEDLGRFALTTSDVLRNTTLPTHPRRHECWRALMQFEIARARSLYERASPGIALLAADAQRTARACATGYARILNAIESLRYDTFSARARLGRWARAGVLWTTLVQSGSSS